MDRIAIKSLAKEQIKGKIGILFVIYLIVAVISIVAGMILSAIPVIGPLVSSIFISPAFTLSLAMIYINISKGITPVAGDAFNGFYDFWSSFKVGFFTGLFTILWSLLFIVPGIVKGFSYSMAMYILAENKGMPALEAINKSKQMMNGRKMDLFVLSLSFIGWILLGYITFGIAFIWVIPYTEAATVNFYNKIKGDISDEAADNDNPVAIPEILETANQPTISEPEVISEQ